MRAGLSGLISGAADMRVVGLDPETVGLEIVNARLSDRNPDYVDALYLRLQREGYLMRDVQRILSGFGIRGRIYCVSRPDKPSFSYTRADGTTVWPGISTGSRLRCVESQRGSPDARRTRPVIGRVRIHS